MTQQVGMALQLAGWVEEEMVVVTMRAPSPEMTRMEKAMESIPR